MVSGCLFSRRVQCSPSEASRLLNGDRAASRLMHQHWRPVTARDAVLIPISIYVHDVACHADSRTSTFRGAQPIIMLTNVSHGAPIFVTIGHTMSIGAFARGRIAIALTVTLASLIINNVILLVRLGLAVWRRRITVRVVEMHSATLPTVSSRQFCSVVRVNQTLPVHIVGNLCHIVDNLVDA